MNNRVDREQLWARAKDELSSMTERLASLPNLDLSTLDPAQTVLVIIDMNNGFAKSGSLYSDRISALIPGIVGLARQCRLQGIPIVAYSDFHTDRSPELRSYPPHCMENSEEHLVINELQEVGIDRVIAKNSTNGLMVHPEANLLRGLGRGDERNLIIVGDCTDICIYQYAVTVKAFFNEGDIDARVIVPTNLVDTFDAPGHSADLMNVVFLNSMLANGVEVVASIR
ncbi:MAG: isochorismatase family cysteine hydrolase [Bacillota bacterium]